MFWLSAILVHAALHTSSGLPSSGSIRSDLWNHALTEHGCDDPKSGRRVHLVLDGVGAGVTDTELASVKINGKEGLKLDTSSSADLGNFDWLRAHTNNATGAIWISYHTRNAAQAASSLSVHVATVAGKVLFDGTVSAGAVEEELTLAYTAFRKGGTEVVLHVHNSGTKGATLGSMAFDGMPVTLPAAARKPVPPGGHLVIVAPVPGAAKVANDVWTATLGGALGFGGRVMASERFVVQAWPHSSDCALPGANDANAQELLSLGIDSVYYTKSFDKTCGKALTDVVNQLASTGMHVFTDTHTASAVSAAARSASIDAVLLGDEVDGDVDADHLRGALDKAYKAQSDTPSVPTYMGSKTTRNMGAFAGIADIQGSDAYCAACAPTMLAAAKKLPLQYPFYYLRNARDNHAPGTFWGYAQLYSDAWSYQADAPELIAQLGQLVLSGSKALMFFQAYHDQFEQHKVSDIRHVIQSVRAVGSIIREGDTGGMAFSTSSKLNEEVMVAVIRSPEQLLVAIVNTNAKGYSNLLCHTGLDKHWTFSKHTIKKLVLDPSSAPDVSQIGGWHEAVEGKIVPLSGVSVSTDGATLNGIDLDDNVPVRFLVANVTSSSSAP